jgi:biopolymer transport protein TolR
MRARYSRRKRLMGEINVVPYIDVMLVLLVIFMVTTPLLTEGVRVEMVKADSQPIESKDEEPFVVTVDAEGNYYLPFGENPKAPVEPGQITVQAAAVLKHRAGSDFLVRGDAKVPYEKVVQAMVLLQQAGVPSVGLITEPVEAR